MLMHTRSIYDMSGLFINERGLSEHTFRTCALTTNIAMLAIYACREPQGSCFNHFSWILSLFASRWCITAFVQGQPWWHARRRRRQSDITSGKRLRTSWRSSVSCFTRKKLSTMMASRMFSETRKSRKVYLSQARHSGGW